jgi:predicted aconitase
MFHAVGVTPEAPTPEAATGGEAVPVVLVTADAIRQARDELGPAEEGPLGAVCVGTPHASLGELERLRRLLDDRRPAVPLWVNTSRAVLAEADRHGVAAALRDAGVAVVADTCTYLTPLIGDVRGAVMTDSGKWAWYAPTNLGVEVAFGGIEECVRSAIEGRIVRDASLWGDA